jgi:hypothetical protein
MFTDREKSSVSGTRVYPSVRSGKYMISSKRSRDSISERNRRRPDSRKLPIVPAGDHDLWDNILAIIQKDFHPPFKSAPLAQLDRASGYEPEGREFESLRAHH